MSYRTRTDSADDFPLLTALSCVVCILVFAIINLTPDKSDANLARIGLLSDRQILSGSYWGLITMAFVHIEPLHLFFNLTWIWSLGGAVERSLGMPKWLILVLSSAFVSSGIEFMMGSAGIGFSGVVYALFGFAWMARSRYPLLMMIINKQTVQIMVGWAVLCLVLTKLNVMHIANGAHFGGMLFGMAVGAAVGQPRFRIPAVLGTVACIAIACLSLVWNPLSLSWNAIQVSKARTAHDWNRALDYTERAQHLGANPTWYWLNVAEIDGLKGDRAGYENALRQLKYSDPSTAQEVADEFSQP